MNIKTIKIKSTVGVIGIEKAAFATYQASKNKQPEKSKYKLPEEVLEKYKTPINNGGKFNFNGREQTKKTLKVYFWMALSKKKTDTETFEKAKK